MNSPSLLRIYSAAGRFCHFSTRESLKICVDVVIKLELNSPLPKIVESCLTISSRDY